MNVPFALIAHLLLPKERKLFIYVQTFNFLRVLRLKTAARYFENTLIQLNVDDRFHDAILLVYYWAVFIHFTACLYIVPGLIMSDFRLIEVNSWFEAKHFQEASFGTKYIMCLSKSVRSIMGNGHINFLKETESFDIIFDYLVTIFGRIGLFISIGFLMLIIKGALSSSQKYDGLMVELDKYMDHHKLPKSTREKLKNTYEFKFDKRYFNETKIIEMLPPSLKHQVMIHNTRELVENSTFFKGLPELLTIKILTSLKPELYMKDDILFLPGEAEQTLYFITSGLIAFYSSSGIEVRHFSDGDYFGISTSLIGENLRFGKAIALDTTECYK